MHENAHWRARLAELPTSEKTGCYVTAYRQIMRVMTILRLENPFKRTLPLQLYIQKLFHRLEQACLLSSCNFIGISRACNVQWFNNENINRPLMHPFFIYFHEKTIFIKFKFPIFIRKLEVSRQTSYKWENRIDFRHVRVINFTFDETFRFAISH